MTDFIVRLVPYYGYLPIIVIDGKEMYRGEFKPTAQTAFDACEKMYVRLNARNPDAIS